MSEDGPMPPGPPGAPGTTRAPPPEGMGLTRLALSNPTATLVAVLLVVLFGGLGLARLPVQLTPEVEKPEITIRTGWRAAAPEEIEAEIIEPQEKVLRGLSGVSRIVSKAQRGQGEVSIEFVVGHDLRRGLIEVLNRLNRVPRYPEDANEPVIDTVGGNSRAIAWFTMRTRDGNPRDIQSYKDYAEEVVQTRFERVPGVARSEVYGGREREVRITFDPYRAASLGIELPVAARLAGANQDISGGDVSVGKRRYTLRFTGAFDAEDLGDLVLEWRDGLPVRLRDVAEIEVSLADRKSFVLSKGARSLAVNAHREIGVNVLEVMAGLKEAAAELVEGPLARAGLVFEQVYDETVYIHRSVNMVRNNLALGITLAILSLWWFLRRLRATVLIAARDPDLALRLLPPALHVTGRTLNIISLAGLALAVGMTLDAAIVVLENIVRLRERGTSMQEAATLGPAQVWGALLASTATTVAIFLPHRVPLRRGRPALRRSRPHHLGGGGRLDARGAHRDPRRGIEVARTRAGSAMRTRAGGRRLTGAILHLTDGPGEKGGSGSPRADRDTARDLPRARAEVDPEPRSASRTTFAAVAAGVALSRCARATCPRATGTWSSRSSSLPPARTSTTSSGDGQRRGGERLQPYLDGEKEPAIESYFFVAFSRGRVHGREDEGRGRAPTS